MYPKFSFLPWRRFISCILVFTLTFGPNCSYGQSALVTTLPEPGQMLGMSEDFTPVILKGMVIHPDDSLKFDFLMDTGTNKTDGDDLRQEAEKSIKYFLASLTVPENDLWVNLSPFEKDRIIPDAFGKTVMGRDLLAEDYVLKQLASSLLYPENSLGKSFWSKIYETARRELGTTEMDVNNFNRVWIVPSVAQVWEHDGKVIILNSHLKVMLEEDYLASEKSGKDHFSLNPRSTQLFRDILAPAIEKEVNEGANFARLRQVYSAMILAAWYKIRLKESLLGKAYADQNKVIGVEFGAGVGKEDIYNRYLEAARKGVFNYIREDIDSTTNEPLPRKYFSGGFIGKSIKSLVLSAILTGAPEALNVDVQRAAQPKGSIVIVEAAAADIGLDADTKYSVKSQMNETNLRPLLHVSEEEWKQLIEQSASHSDEDSYNSMMKLSRIGDQKSILYLITRLKQDYEEIPYDHTSEYAADALVRVGKPAINELALVALKAKHQLARENAVRALAQIGGEEVIRPIVDALMLEDDTNVIYVGIDSLAKMGKPGTDALITLLKAKFWFAREYSAKTLGFKGGPTAIPALLNALSDENPRVAREADLALKRLGIGSKERIQLWFDRLPIKVKYWIGAGIAASLAGLLMRWSYGKVSDLKHRYSKLKIIKKLQGEGDIYNILKHLKYWTVQRDVITILDDYVAKKGLDSLPVLLKVQKEFESTRYYGEYNVISLRLYQLKHPDGEWVYKYFAESTVDEVVTPAEGHYVDSSLTPTYDYAHLYHIPIWVEDKPAETIPKIIPAYWVKVRRGVVPVSSVHIDASMISRQKNLELTYQALNTGKVNLNAIKDVTLRSFLNFINSTPGLSDFVVVGGSVRDIFWDNSVKDIDITVITDLTNEERLKARNVGSQVSRVTYEKAMDAIGRLASAMKIPIERFFDYENAPVFNGLRLHFVGPSLNTSNDGKEEVILKGIIVDRQTRSVLSQYTAPGLLQMALDSVGNVYNYKEPLQDVTNGIVRMRGDLDGGHNLFLVAIIKWLRLKHELGLNLLPADYLLVKKALTLAETSSQNNESSPLIKQAIQELIDQAIDPEAAVKELDNLGVTDRADFHPKVIQSEVAASPKEGNNNGEPNKVGGIDLDAKKLDLRIKRDGSGVPLPVDQQDWSKINIQGFTPVIYKIAPVNIITLLGLNKVGQASPDSHSEKAAIVLPEGKELGS